MGSEFGLSRKPILAMTVFEGKVEIALFLWCYVLGKGDIFEITHGTW
jgi:hypothetical protein